MYGRTADFYTDESADLWGSCVHELLYEGSGSRCAAIFCDEGTARAVIITDAYLYLPWSLLVVCGNPWWLDISWLTTYYIYIYRWLQHVIPWPIKVEFPTSACCCLLNHPWLLLSHVATSTRLSSPSWVLQNRRKMGTWLTCILRQYKCLHTLHIYIYTYIHTIVYIYIYRNFTLINNYIYI